MEAGARALISRLMREVQLLRDDPPPGVAAWPVSEVNITRFEAQIYGPPGTPYEEGTFVLDIEVPDRYPFEPPRVRFVTPIFHPNIDDRGRICLDTLKPQPQGTWSPCINLSTLLTTIRLLMAHPNADDGLSPEATHLYRRDPTSFEHKARTLTAQHASVAAAQKEQSSTASDVMTQEGHQASSASAEQVSASSSGAAEPMEGVVTVDAAHGRGEGAMDEDEEEGESEYWDSDVSLCGDEDSHAEDDDEDSDSTVSTHACGGAGPSRMDEGKSCGGGGRQGRQEEDDGSLSIALRTRRLKRACVAAASSDQPAEKRNCKAPDGRTDMFFR